MKPQTLLIRIGALIILMLSVGCMGSLQAVLEDINVPGEGNLPSIPGGPTFPTTPGAGVIPFQANFLTSTPNQAVILPLRADSGNAYGITVSWGDGSYSQFSSGMVVPVSHTYATAGTHVVQFWGTADAFSFATIPDSKNRIVSVANLGNLGWKSFEGAFEDTTALTSVSVGTGADTTQVVSFSNFLKNSSVSTVNMSGVDSTQTLSLRGCLREPLLLLV